MTWPIVSRRRYVADLAAAKAETTRQRERAEKAEGIARTEVNVRRTITEQHASLDERYADVCIVNECLTRDLTEARNQLTAHQNAPSKDWRSKYEAEKKRADHLQRQLDDAVGLEPRQIQDSARWQPGYVDKAKAAKEAAS